MKGKKAKVCNCVFVLFCVSTRIYSARARCLESGLTYLRRLRFARRSLANQSSILLIEGPPRVIHLTLKFFYVDYSIRESAFYATFGALVMSNLSSVSLENRFHRCQ